MILPIRYSIIGTEHLLKWYFKSEAVFLFAKVLNKYGIDYFQDMPKLYSNYLYISEEIMQISGQRSGISLKYF